VYKRESIDISSMRNRILLIILLLGNVHCCHSKTLEAFADSIRKAYHIPELGYAVVSSDKVYELGVMGVKKKGTKIVAKQSDIFRIGSNTKAITGYLAAILVKEGKIGWDTKFFDLFPELKAKSRKEYYDVTLLNLLSFRTKLFSYTYTYAKPIKDQFTGDEEQQRYQFAAWFFQHEPVRSNDSVSFSNLGYVAAGMMMEKASGKAYKTLVKELGDQLGIDFHYGRPNNIAANQPWGHGENLTPEPPGDDFKLSWLLPAGNISLCLPDYVKFIQMQLQGLAGKSTILAGKEFDFLHYGLSKFAVGWFWDKDEEGRPFSYNVGNPGTFLTAAYVYKGSDKAFILFANAQTDASEEGFEVLYNEMKRRYLNK